MPVVAVEVSVIVPTKDRWERLERTLATVRTQRGVTVEVIVVDDGSRVAGQPDGVELVRLGEAHGMAAARNLGVRRAAGRWVAFLDDDDLWSPDKLRRQVEAAQAAGASWAFSGVALVDDALRASRLIPPPDPATLRDQLPVRNVIPAGSSNVLVDRGTFLAVGGFDESLRHMPDWDAWIRLSREQPAAADPEVTVAYVQHATNRGHLHVEEVLAEAALMSRRHGGRLDEVDVTRWLAAAARRGGRRGLAARMYLRTGLRHRDPGSVGRALHAALGLPDWRDRRVPGPEWVRDVQSRSAARIPSVVRSQE